MPIAPLMSTKVMLVIRLLNSTVIAANIAPAKPMSGFVFIFYLKS